MSSLIRDVVGEALLHEELGDFSRRAERETLETSAGGWLAGWRKEDGMDRPSSEPVQLTKDTKVKVDGEERVLPAGTELSEATAAKLGLVGKKKRAA